LKDDKILASQDAVIQERKIHEESVNQAGYKQIAAGVLGRLKKRPPAKNDSDIGIDGEWVDPATRDAKQSISKDLQQYILTEEQLAEMNYPLPDALNVSQLQDSPIGLVQQCDRCKTQFTVKDMLKKQDLEACQYHYGRLRKIKIHGNY
jgi:RNA exonuclease 1